MRQKHNNGKIFRFFFFSSLASSSVSWYHCLDFSLTHDDGVFQFSILRDQPQLECDIRIYEILILISLSHVYLALEHSCRFFCCCRFMFFGGHCFFVYMLKFEMEKAHIEITCDRELYVNICKTSNVVHQQDKMRWIAIFFSSSFFFRFYICFNVFWSCRFSGEILMLKPILAIVYIYVNWWVLKAIDCRNYREQKRERKSTSG